MIKISLITIFTCLALTSLVSSKYNFEDGYKLSIPHQILESFMDSPPKDLFKVFHHVYDKTKEYELNSEEGITKYKAFKANLKLIKSENLKEENDFKLGLTPFADMTNQEFQDKMLMKNSAFEETQKNMESVSEDFFDKMADQEDFLTQKTTPRNRDAINWSNAFFYARFQNTCGSCWAFSAAGAIEAVRALNGQSKISLSPQQMVDCIPESHGCDGGWAQHAINYAINTGIVADDDYKYNNKQGTCNTSVVQNKAKYKIKNFAACTGDSCTDDAWYALLKRGPIVVRMDASHWKIQLYIAGVLDLGTSECKSTNHAVVAMAWDKRSWLFKYAEYVKVRNSWGLWWGEGGNFRINYNKSGRTCFITSYGLLPMMTDN